MVKIRFEGIDALETHFRGSHQDLSYANAARDLMLKTLGFENVKYYDDSPNKVESADNNSLPGFILASGIEGNGRVLAFVYPDGALPQCVAGKSDGEPVFVAEADIDVSANRLIVADGLAYVEPYTPSR